VNHNAASGVEVIGNGLGNVNASINGSQTVLNGSYGVV
jgi:hypothetical protein